MELLTGHDASFLYMETPTTFNHGCGLMIIDPSTMPGGFSMAALRDWYIPLLPHLPTYTEKVWDPWYNLGHPAWIADDSFDIDRHLLYRKVPAPGTDAALAQVCGEIIAQPLDLSRPLWEMWVLDGLADGTVAILSKFHNACVDGVQGNSLFGQLTSDTEQVFTHADPPTPLALALTGLRTVLLKPVKLTRLIVRGLLARVTGSTPKLPEGVPSPLSAPRTSFNTTLTANRNVAWVSLDGFAVRDVKRKLGVTINDVGLALIATALRRYLLDRNELPNEPLQAFVPIAVHEQLEHGGKNQTSGLLTSLHTGIEDPIERAFAIAQTTNAAKVHAQSIGPGRLHEWFELAAPWWGRVFRLYSRLRLADRHAVMQNLVVSNMGGRLQNVTFAGARVTEFYALGAPLDGGALFAGIVSLDNQINIGLVACPEIVPELDQLAADLENALDELTKAVEQRDDLAPNTK